MTPKTAPICCEREMIAVKDEKNNPIYWCADCHKRIKREPTA